MDKDRSLVERCQTATRESFEDAFADIYQLYKDRVYNIAYRITGNRADAMDAAQETFGILFRKMRSFRFDSKFSSWVYRIGVNASIDLKRRNVARRTHLIEDLGSIGPGRQMPSRSLENSEPETAAAGHELEDEIQRAMDGLSPKLRAAIVLRHIQDLSYEEISDVLSCSLGTVKSRLSRAHEALAKTLSPVIEKHYLG